MRHDPGRLANRVGAQVAGHKLAVALPQANQVGGSLRDWPGQSGCAHLADA